MVSGTVAQVDEDYTNAVEGVVHDECSESPFKEEEHRAAEKFHLGIEGFFSFLKSAYCVDMHNDIQCQSDPGEPVEDPCPASGMLMISQQNVIPRIPGTSIITACGLHCDELLLVVDETFDISHSEYRVMENVEKCMNKGFEKQEE
jgi:hypothetical protein